jgi:DNA-binding transcriptional regulator GbsR (MarR family)
MAEIDKKQEVLTMLVFSPIKELNAQEVSDILGYSKSTVNSWFRYGTLKAKKRFRNGQPRWFIRKQDLLAFIENYVTTCDEIDLDELDYILDDIEKQQQRSR